MHKPSIPLLRVTISLLLDWVIQTVSKYQSKTNQHNCKNTSATQPNQHRFLYEVVLHLIDWPSFLCVTVLLSARFGLIVAILGDKFSSTELRSCYHKLFNQLFGQSVRVWSVALVTRVNRASSGLTQ